MRKPHRIFYKFKPYFVEDNKFMWELCYLIDLKEWSGSLSIWKKNLAHWQLAKNDFKRIDKFWDSDSQKKEKAEHNRREVIKVFQLNELVEVKVLAAAVNHGGLDTANPIVHRKKNEEGWEILS